jgi:hypothetical protein
MRNLVKKLTSVDDILFQRHMENIWFFDFL